MVSRMLRNNCSAGRIVDALDEFGIKVTQRNIEDASRPVACLEVAGSSSAAPPSAPLLPSLPSAAHLASVTRNCLQSTLSVTCRNAQSGSLIFIQAALGTQFGKRSCLSRLTQETRRFLNLPTLGCDASMAGMEPQGSDAKERINNQVAITVAMLAAFMAVTKVTDDNVCQAMEREKANEVNAWSYFQSKSIKQNLAEQSRAQLTSLALTVTGDARSKYEEEIKHCEQDIARYEVDKNEIEAKAKGHEKNYSTLNFRDDQFDLSDATLSIALAMLAVTALTGKRWLLATSWGLGGFGMLFGVAGLLKLNFSIEWLVKLLS